MGKLLKLEKILREDVLFSNQVYGKASNISFVCNDTAFLVTIQKNRCHYAFEVKFSLQGEHFLLLLEKFPSVSRFSKSFENVDIFSLPPELQLIVFRSAMENLQNYFEDKLKSTISIDDIRQIHSTETVPGIEFTLSKGNEFVTNGKLVAPANTLLALTKKLQQQVRIRNFRNLKTSYYTRVGTTYLPKDDYKKLSQGDVVFLDEHDLAIGKKVSILGLEGAEILGTFEEGGVRVTQIT